MRSECGWDLHTGTAEILPDGKYEGYATIASTQRVMSAAHGGQTLLTQTTYELLQNTLPDDVPLRDMGEHRLKDLRTPVLATWFIRPDLKGKGDYHGILLSPHNYPGAAGWANSFTGYKSASNTG